MKNCGRRFHLLVTSKDFVQDLFKLIGPKNDPSAALQEKVLNLIQTWAEAFRAQPELNGVVSVYRELKAKGIEFPPTDLDSMAPIHTPQRSAPASAGTVAHHNLPSQRPTRSPPQVAHEVTPVNLTQEQIEKLKSDLCLVQENMSIFDSMLNEMTPGKEHIDDRTLLQELNSTCRQMQQRVVELIDQVVNEEITIELLRVNDELNNLFVRYDRFVKKYSPEHATASESSAAIAGATASSKPLPPSQGESSLIDLDDDDSKPSVAIGGEQFLSRFSHMKVTGDNSSKFKTPTGVVAAGEMAGNVHGDDFDQFAQSRSTTSTTTTSTGAASSKIPHELGEALLLDREEDYEEIARWLKENDAGGKSDKAPQGANATGTSGTDSVDSGSDFERFLIERAAAAERLPPSGNTSSKPPTSKSDPFGL